MPITSCIYNLEVLSNEKKGLIEEVLEEKSNKPFVDYQEIQNIILNNEELKSLENLVTSSSFNLSSQISKRYPSLNLQANGLPKYISGKKYDSDFQTLKTSQFSVNPSINIKWDFGSPIFKSN